MHARMFKFITGGPGSFVHTVLAKLTTPRAFMDLREYAETL